MAEDVTGTNQPEGQVESAPENGTTETTPVSASGQPAKEASPGTTKQRPHVDDESNVFDPQEYERLIKNLPDDLQKQANALRKSLQGSYTKKAQQIAQERQKVEAYDAFSRDPLGQLTQMAQRMGYKLVGGQSQEQPAGSNWEPQTWDEVLNKAETLAEQRIMQKLQPLLGEFQNIRKASIETQLAEIDPGWQQYEDAMMDNLQMHPTLAKDPAKLYRMSVPQEVLESRATQRALKKLESKVESGKVSGGSTTTKTPKTGMPDGPISFQQAVELAKKKMSEEGIGVQ